MTPLPTLPPIITLTTDFGLVDEYVGVMKGVILSHAPTAQLVDISHTIPPQDILQGSRVIARAYPFFPRKSFHLIVVDPGVGSQRQLLALQSDDHTFVAPDNGLLSPLLTKAKFSMAYRIENLDILNGPISNTFHGRDIMAPVIAQLAMGLEISKLGRQVCLEDCVHVHQPMVQVTNGRIEGEVIAIDSFGNIQTSIHRNNLNNFSDLKNIEVTMDTLSIRGLNRSYGEKKTGEFLVLIDSSNHLEIAVNGGNAALSSQCFIGQRIIIKAKE